MYALSQSKESSLFTFLTLLSTACAQISFSLLPDTYPAPQTIPHIIERFVERTDWQSSQPATVIRSCPRVGDWGLTYDDGPSHFSPQLLDHLKATGIKATFFVIGGNVRNNPNILKRMYDEGHEIGLHTWSHLHIKNTENTPEQLVMEIGWNIKSIKDIIGVTPRLFRPPYGELTEDALKVIGAFDLTVVMWDTNRDTQDWRTTKNPESTLLEVKQRWIPGLRTRGMISLEHEITQNQINLAINILDAAKHAHVKPGPVGTCIGLTNDNWYQEGRTKEIGSVGRGSAEVDELMVNEEVHSVTSTPTQSNGYIHSMSVVVMLSCIAVLFVNKN